MTIFGKLARLSPEERKEKERRNEMNVFKSTYVLFQNNPKLNDDIISYITLFMGQVKPYPELNLNFDTKNEFDEFDECLIQ